MDAEPGYESVFYCDSTRSFPHSLPHTQSDDDRYLDEGEVNMVTWKNLDAVMSEYTEKISGKHQNRRPTLQFRTSEEGAAGEGGRCARELVRQLSVFLKVGNVEYVSNL